MSPSNRSSTPSRLRCERKSRRYNGIGGSNAPGTGLKDLETPESAAVASNRVNTRIVNAVREVVVERSKEKPVMEA